MDNIFRWVGGIFIAVGAILLLAVAILLHQDRSFAASASVGEGTVVRLVPGHARADERGSSSGATYTAIVAFTDRTGRRHEFSEGFSSNPPRLATGEKVRVLYDPDNPLGAVVDDFWGRKGVAAIMGGVALPITLVGILLLVIDFRHRRRRARLLRDGQPIEAEFLHVFRDSRISRNGEHPYRVVAQARDPASGRIRRFESDPVWVDLTQSLQGKPVRILVDPRNRAGYHVDLSGLMECD